ncbi:MAG TPA: YlxR family protein [Anaerolineae bacterium]|nr:YlxR family protein [Anaerolineae bacterium]HIQ05968.1 YlxR family protein [Anaerolineae bacterium]
MVRHKHIPQRTCVACRQVRAKRELVRIVRALDGHVMVDPTGKKAGRGAYLCRHRACWEQALSGRRLEAALHTQISPQDRAALEAYAAELPSQPGETSVQAPSGP